jgi:hypothetical protein
MPTPSMPGPSIEVYQVDSIHHVVKTPCGNTSLGITTSDDLPIQVRRALDHARECERCLGRASGLLFGADAHVSHGVHHKVGSCTWPEMQCAGHPDGGADRG